MAGNEIKNFTGLRASINGKKFDLPNNNLVSLNVNRVMGDSANAFTLEVFDETAMDIEMVLMNNKGSFPNIEVYYRGKADDPEQHFTGTIYDYQPTFVGSSMMLSITGYVGSSAGYGLLAKSSVAWIKPAEPFKVTINTNEETGQQTVQADSQGSDAYMLSWLRNKNTKEPIALSWNEQYRQWEMSSDINPDNVETYTYTDDWTQYNPNRPNEVLVKTESTREVIWKNENGEYEFLKYANFPLVYVVDPLMEGYEQSTSYIGTNSGPYTDNYKPEAKQINKLRARPVISQQRVKPSEVFKRVIERLKLNKDLNISLGEVEETCWVYYADWNQTSQTPYSYIEEVLCNRALGKDGNAGYYFYVDDKGKANFKQMGYFKGKSKSVNIEYGKKDSNVISFTTSQKGAVSMLGAVYDDEGNQSVDTDVIDEFTGDITNSNLIGYTNVSDEGGRVGNTNQLYQKYVPKTINYSSSKDNISAMAKWVKVANLVSKAELKIWGTTQDGYGPGDYLQVNVMGKKGLHYTTGLYWIIKETDSISKSGFVKTMTLIKTGNTQEVTSNVNAREACKSYGLTEADLYTKFINEYTADEAAHKSIISNEKTQDKVDELNEVLRRIEEAEKKGNLTDFQKMQLVDSILQEKGIKQVQPITNLDETKLYNSLEEAQEAANKKKYDYSSGSGAGGGFSGGGRWTAEAGGAMGGR